MTLLDDDAVEPISNGSTRTTRVADRDALRELHRQHISTCPTRRSTSTRRAGAVRHGRYRKIVHRRRGGIARAQLAVRGAVAGTGYEVDVLAARVFDEGRLGPLQGHMVMRVVTADSPEPWLSTSVTALDSCTRCAWTHVSCNSTRTASISS